MAIQAVIWDYGGVLVQMVDEAPRRALARRLKIDLKTLYRLVFDSDSARRGAQGEIAIEQHWQAIGRVLKVGPAELPQVIEDFWAADGLDEALLDYIRSLRPGYRQAVLSNAWSDLRLLLRERWQILDVFDEVIVSAEVGMLKPDPRIYGLALARLGLQPSEVVFLDDRPENVNGALSAGMHAIQYQNLAQARQALLQLGVEPPA